MLNPPRPTAVFPTRLTTGTPIHNASHVVVPPPYGNVSNATSIPRYNSKYRSVGKKPENATRPGSIPSRAKRSCTRTR